LTLAVTRLLVARGDRLLLLHLLAFIVISDTIACTAGYLYAVIAISLETVIADQWTDASLLRSQPSNISTLASFASNFVPAYLLKATASVLMRPSRCHLPEPDDNRRGELRLHQLRLLQGRQARL
jgi:hypothetical protein